MARDLLFKIQNTEFITFGPGKMTNLQGDKSRDPMFGSTARRANILLSPEDMQRFEEAGIPYRHMDANPEKDYRELNFINATIYDNEYYPAKIYVQIGDNPARLLPFEDLAIIDKANDQHEVQNVSVTVSPFVNNKNTWSYSIRVMHVDMIDGSTDPFERPAQNAMGDPFQ